MAQSTLLISFTELETEIGRFLGYPRSTASWSANQVLDFAAILKQGMRQFYFPQPTAVQVAQGQKAHRWSFLRPQAQLTIWDDVVAADAITASTATYASPVTTITASDDVFYPSMEEKTIVFGTSGNSFVIDSYVSATVVKVTGDASAEDGNVITIDSGDTFTLPWDFGALSGDGSFAYHRDSAHVQPIALTSDANIRQLRMGSVSSGTPYLAAITPLSTDGSQGQRHVVQFHPPPSDVFVLTYRYHILPNALVDTTAEYPYGSVAHSQTILASCLAVAEVREKDDATATQQARFANLLQGSIDHDRQYGESAIELGYNGDGSDGDAGESQRNYHQGMPLTMFDGEVWG